MPINVEYDESLDSMIIETIGTVGCDEICLLRDQLLEHADFRENINQLFDASRGQLDLSADDLQKIASYYIVKSEQLGNNRKLALVVSKELDFGRMRQYEVYFYSGPTVYVKAFRNLSEAREWLKQK